jgi:preprotein translocase subunit SecD
MRLARGLLPLAFVLLLAVGCGGSSRRNCSEIVLRAIPPKGQQVRLSGMQIAQQIVESRVKKLGVSSPQVTIHGDELVIQYSGKPDVDEVAHIAGTPGRLQIFDFEPSLAPASSVSANQQPTPLSSLYKLLKAVQSRAGTGSPRAYYLFKASGSHSPLQGPASSVRQLLSSYTGGRQPAHTVVLKVPANTELVRCAGTTNCPGAGSNGTSQSGVYWYPFKGSPALTGKDLVESGITADVAQNGVQPIVTVQFTKHGSNAFRQMTEAEYNRGRVSAGLAGKLNATNYKTIATYAGHNAIVLDGQLMEVPYIDYTDSTLSQGIGGGAVQITEATTQEAKQTALVLQTGSLPYTFVQVGPAGCKP